MTDEKIALRTLMEKGSDATFLREMIGFAAQRLMELETDTLCGAAHGEHSDSRINYRNGYRDRDWETRAGTVELRIPVSAAAKLVLPQMWCRFGLYSERGLWRHRGFASCSRWSCSCFRLRCFVFRASSRFRRSSPRRIM